ncbi:PREDICTED: uncharacterized protein K02A2.6-like [Wasmannia auropunctata]|uniref:uncharacterized protein K02A2.6-like n=1 Tax=Wasmannia auropunctata TaxID=64793 RepID=UPI0005EE6225|nr:PREDICTED: uncharacterized protein K02A2.6-like [Wasmannia auropunctata]
MNSEQLRPLKINQLRSIAAREKIGATGTWTRLFDRLVDHFVRVEWPEERYLMEFIGEPGGERPTSEAGVEPMEAMDERPPGTTIVQAVVEVLDRRRPGGDDARWPRAGSLKMGAESTSSQMSMNSWQQIRVATKMIPTFTGTEKESVVKWLEQITGVSQLYQLGDEVIVLAAISQLQGRALEWYNRQQLESVATWDNFKFEIRRHFEVKESYTATLARLGQRTWRSYSEKFVDYAEEKLTMMQVLTLTEREKIDLLADGVRDPILRKMVLSTWVTSVPEFLDHVRRITEDAVMLRRAEARPGSVRDLRGAQLPLEAGARTEMLCHVCKKPWHLARFCRERKQICYRCGQEGHISSRCAGGRGTATGATASSHLVELSGAGELEEAAAETLHINHPRWTSGGEACVGVRVAANPRVILRALVDTGSPVSLIRQSAYYEHMSSIELTEVERAFALRGVNDSSIAVVGRVRDRVLLDGLSESWYEVDLMVVSDGTMKYDLLLGRGFFDNAKLKLVYQAGNYTVENVQDNEIPEIFAINMCSEIELSDAVVNKVNRDLPHSVTVRLREVFEEVEKAAVQPVEDGYCAKVYLKDESFRYAPRRMSVTEKVELDRIIDDLLMRKIIKPSVSPYCSRVVLVTKRNGSKRMCVDLRALNQRIYQQKYPFPIIEDQLSQLYGKRIFTKLDLKDGFHQIAIHPDCTKYFSFATHNGQFEFRKLPFGFSEAPAEFQKRINGIFRDLIRAGRVLVYMDDLLIATETVDENLEILKEVLTLLKKYKLELNISKCLFLEKEMEYLGYMISGRGITLCDRHIRAIIDYPPPTNIRQLQGFLGLCNYFRKFIKDYAQKTKSLQNLLRKGVDYVFDENCVDEFENLKRELTSSPILCVYNPKAITELHTDASSLGYGAILFQRQEDNALRPIAYFSKATTEVESKYHSFELETLAIVKAIERFHIYVQGINFKIVTDCNSLVLAMKKININPRIARWSLMLQNYQFELVHRASGKMMHVDCLSRHFGTVCMLNIEDELMYKQLMDPKLKEIATELEFKENKYFVLIDGLLFRHVQDKQLFVVPESMIHHVIRIYHDEMGHVGADKTVQGILAHYWFPCLRHRVKQYIENCVTCLGYAIAAGKAEGEMELVDSGKVPMSMIHVNHFGPLERTPEGYKHVLVVVDAHKICMAVPL